ncbi:DUF2934 domain-containing protein [Corallococcus llansteffanensis]|uniref:DUF2934 domain-containing protein n=1 Tax=Corallococcus llansteffanensis TaxID=2316731 RepID=A0A3A8P8P9_9BACT|nr:DUF2934 domain-containing protein [Corallococcus llansteffanensis]RKH49825.1 DUF2934 domain-containing protein [Corallococcus llansteffanensis]
MARQNSQKMPQSPAPKSTPERPQDPTAQPAASANATRSPSPAPTNEQIARRAFEIYQARGGTHGSSEQDWFQAERELKLGRQ